MDLTELLDERLNIVGAKLVIVSTASPVLSAASGVGEIVSGQLTITGAEPKQGLVNRFRRDDPCLILIAVDCLFEKYPIQHQYNV